MVKVTAVQMLCQARSMSIGGSSRRRSLRAEQARAGTLRIRARMVAVVAQLNWSPARCSPGRG